MVAIPEIEQLPNNCHECPLSMWIEGEYWCPWNNCTVDGVNNGDKRRMSGCPLIEIEESDE